MISRKVHYRALLIFLGTIAITVSSLLLFIQSKSFAEVLKQTARKYMPIDLGVDGDFQELAVKLIPPGVVIKKPAVTLREKNPLGLPGGTKIDAQFIDVTFQFFQLMTGAVTINAFAIHGATFKLDLNEKFFADHSKPSPSSKKLSSKSIWDSLVQFNFRSVSLVDSQVDIRMTPQEGAAPMTVQAYAKELTVGRSTIDSLPAYDLAIDLQRARFERAAFKQSLAQVQASIEVSTRGASIRNISLQEGEMNLHANGQLRGNIFAPKPLKSDLSYIIRGPLQNWLNPDLLGAFIKIPKDVETPTGNIVIEGKLTGDLADIERTIETKASVGFEDLSVAGFKLDKGALKITAKGPLKTPALALDSAEFKFGDGTVKLGKLAYDGANPRKEFHLSAELDNADFRRLLGPALNAAYPLHMFLTGSVDADISLEDGFALEGSTDMKVKQFSFDNQRPTRKAPLKVLLAVPELRLKSNFAVDEGGVSFDQTEVELPRSKLKASGSVGGKTGFDIDINGKVNTVDIGKLAAFDIRGEGPLHWTIKGKLPDVVFSFEAELKDAAYLNLNLGDVKGRVVYNDGTDTIHFENLHAKQGRSEFNANGTIDVGKTDAIDLAIQVPHATIQDFSVVFDSFLKKAVPWYPYELLGQMSGLIRATGKTDLDQLSIEGDMNLENVDYHHELFRTAKLHAGYRRGAYIAENVAIRKKNGMIYGNMNFGADDVLKFDLRSENFSTLDIDRFAALGIPYRAPLSLQTQGHGKLGSLKSSFKLALGDGVIKSTPVGKSSLNFVTDNGRLKGELSVFEERLSGHLDWGWEKGAQSAFDIEARAFDFKPMLVALNSSLAEDSELSSEVTGAAHLRFLTGALSKMSGSVGLKSYSLRRKGYTLDLSRPVDFQINNGNYEFTGAKLVGDGTSLLARGKATNGVIDYSISGALNLGIFEFLVQQIASIRGHVQVDAAISGRAESPDFRAKVVSNGADLRLRDIEQPFEDLKFNVLWRNADINIGDVTSKFAEGQVRGEGRVGLYTYKFPDLDFKAQLENCKVKVYPVAYARTTGKINVKGSDLPLKVSGSINVAEALVKESFSLSEGSRILRSSKFLPQSKGGLGELQVFDLDVNIGWDRNVIVKNDLFDAELRGNIRVINSIKTPRLLGNISVLHGRLLFKDNFFVIQSGDLRFTNPAVLDPEFDLTGQTDVKGYKVSLGVSGAVSDFKLNFQSQPPLSQTDIVSLLALGVTSSEYRNLSRENRDAYSRDEMYGLIFSQSGVNKGLQEKLGLKVRVDQSQAIVPENVFRARSSTDAAVTVAPKVVVQKEVTKNLNASVGSTVGVGENTERNASLEYNLPFMKNWSVLGTYEDQSGPQLKQSRTSIGADLKYKLRFK